MTAIPAIIQARLGSSRLPGKVLHPLRGRPLLLRVVDRLRAARSIGPILVATTTDPTDDALVEWCTAHELSVHRGSVDDVLERTLGAAAQLGCDRLVRVCSDNPFIDATSLDELVAAFDADERADYATYVTSDGQPIIMKPVGVFAEVVSVAALRRVTEESTDPVDRQHVTMFIHQNPERFRLVTLPLRADLDPELRFTVDYPEDVDFCEELLAQMKGTSLDDLIAVLNSHPELRARNLSFSRAHEKRYR